MDYARPVAVRISSIAHATEDTTKVLSAISNLRFNLFSKRPEMTRAKGHFGNELRIYRLEARNLSQTESFLASILGSLSLNDRQTLRQSLDEYLDSSGSLHLRFDKQEAFRGFLALADRDPIKVEVSFEFRGMAADMLRVKVLTELRARLNHLSESLGDRRDGQIISLGRDL